MSSAQIPSNITKVLKKLGLSPSQLLGKGGEGFIFEYDEDRVIKIYGKADKNYLSQLKQFQRVLQEYHLPFATPLILDVSELEGTVYTIEKKLVGKPLDTVFYKLTTNQQYQLLAKYLKVMSEFNAIELPQNPYGQIFKIDNSITANTWHDFLVRKLAQRAKRSQLWLIKDVLDFESKLRLLQKIITEEVRCDKKNLVHSDYYFNNVLVTDDLNISAVLDFSIHTVVGDKRLDSASISFLTLDKHITGSHIQFARNSIIDIYGKDIERYLDLYAMYYAIYYADTYEFDKNSYTWCLSILNNSQIWKRLGL